MGTELILPRGVIGTKEILGGQEIAAGEENRFPFNSFNPWGFFNKHDSPYSFGFSIERYRELLDIFGITQEEMRRINIHVIGEGRLTLPRRVRERILPGGKKRVIGREIIAGLTSLYDDEEAPPTPWGKRPIDSSIYLFVFWHFFQTERRIILRYTRSQQKDKLHRQLLGKHMRVFTITDEMLEFLESSPDVVDERLRRLAGIKLREEILGTTIHEAASHFFDKTHDTVDEEEEMRKKLIARLFGLEYKPPNIMDQFRQHPVVQRFLPNVSKSRPKALLFEDLAKAAEKTLMADPRFRDLIEFEINSDWPFKMVQNL